MIAEDTQDQAVAAILAMSADDLRAAPIAVIAPEDERCTNCTDCTGCTDCTALMYCIYCTGCMYCTYCKGCKGCKDCTDCKDCMYCKDCKDCTYCYKTSGVRNAHYLVLGVQLTADQYAAVMATVQD